VVYRHPRCPHPYNRFGHLSKAWVTRKTAPLEASPELVRYVDPLSLFSSFLKSAEWFCVIVVVLSQKVPKGEKHWNPLGAKQKSALELYDGLREKAGFDSWDVVYHSKTDGVSVLRMAG